jgi:2-polyprenyl-3-methyl-5-hydroxy-6-metoxy-1,4-benzoquinol methylase
MPIDFSKRSEAIEIMDDLTCSGNVVDQTLVELEFINKWLGGNAVTVDGLNSILSITSKNELRLSDLGCGGGDMLKILATELKRRNVSATFTGIDANPNIIEFAKKNSAEFPEIRYEALDILSEDFRNREFDLVFATLFFHHFTSTQLIEIFSLLKRQTKVGIVINDLHRHWLAFYSIKLLTSLFSKSSMVRFDAPLSVLRGFKKKELIEILQNAGIQNYTLRWQWAFRWQLIIRC